MRKILTYLCIVVLSAACSAQESRLIDSFDDLSAWKTNAKEGQLTVSQGPATAVRGPSLSVTVTDGVIYALAYRQFTPDPAWGEFDGLSFRLKGDGSDDWGCIRLQAGNYNKGYLGTFPLKGTEWHEVRLAWGDFVPASCRLPDLGSTDGHRPGDINLIGLGNSWNFSPQHVKPGISFALDDLRLITGVVADRPRTPLDNLPSLAGVRRKLQAGEPVTILALGDSITWGTSAGGNANAYPGLVGRMLAEHYGNEQVTIVSRAIGGSTTAKARQWLMRDVASIQADLVTVMFGYNEMPPAENPQASAEAWVRNLLTYVEEAAGLMDRAPACLLLASIPGRDKHWDRLDVYAEAVREVGREHPNIAVADVNRHFKKLGKEAYADLMADEAHPNQTGQEHMAKVVFEAIIGEGDVQ